MKKLFILLTFIIASYFCYGQNHSIGLSHGHVFSGTVTNFASLDGASSYHFKNGTQYNLNYKYQFSKKFNIISGLQFQQASMRSQNGSTTGELQSWNFQVDNFNIPILANMTFLKYLFAEGGPVLNFQMNKENPYGIDSQSGIGISLGLGAQHQIKNFNFFIKSENQIQALIPFRKENYNDRLIINSLSLGVFYQL